MKRLSRRPWAFYVFLFSVVPACGRVSPPAPSPALAEVRGLWVVRHTLADPDSARAIAVQAGFNTVIVQVWGRGDAYYRSRWEPPPSRLAGRSGYDALARTIREARRRGLRIHAWINTHLVANADTLPVDSSHVIQRRPDLLAVPRSLARLTAEHRIVYLVRDDRIDFLQARYHY